MYVPPSAAEKETAWTASTRRWRAIAGATEWRGADGQPEGNRIDKQRASTVEMSTRTSRRTEAWDQFARARAEQGNAVSLGRRLASTILPFRPD